MQKAGFLMTRLKSITRNFKSFNKVEMSLLSFINAMNTMYFISIHIYMYMYVYYLVLSAKKRVTQTEQGFQAVQPQKMARGLKFGI